MSGVSLGVVATMIVEHAGNRGVDRGMLFPGARSRLSGGQRIGDTLGVAIACTERERGARLLGAGQPAGGGVVLIDAIGARIDDPDVANIARIDGEATGRWIAGGNS